MRDRERLDLDLLGFVLEEMEKLSMPEALRHKLFLERAKVNIINAWEKAEAKRQEVAK